MAAARYVDPDSLQPFFDVDNAAMHAAEFRQHRQQFPRLITRTPEELAEIDALVAGWRREDIEWGRRLQVEIEHERKRRLFGAVLEADVVGAFLEGMR